MFLNFKRLWYMFLGIICYFLFMADEFNWIQLDDHPRIVKCIDSFVDKVNELS